MDTDAVKIIMPDTVSAGLMLETARSVTHLLEARSRIDVEITDGETRERYLRNVNRLQFFFRLVPSILEPRRVICLADRAAENPDWWRANRIHFFCRDLTYSDIAEFLNLRPHQVRDYCQKVHIGNECFDQLPPYQY